MLRPYEAVICPETAHINVDECGAPERIAGAKLVDVPTPDGKLTPELLRSRLTGFGDQHHVQARVASISQSTELGTVYTPEEIAALAGIAHEAGLLLQMDGARLVNAAEALGLELRELTTDCGVDVLTLGGTKSGLLGAEAVVFFRRELAADYLYARKQGTQLASKMRFISAQLLCLFDGDLWRETAGHANAMARRLGDAVAATPGVALAYPVQANAVFAVAAGGGRSSGCTSGITSTSGTRRPASCAGCAPGRPRPPTSTSSPPRFARRRSGEAGKAIDVSDDFRTRAALERVGATHGLDEAQIDALAAYVGLLLGWRRANVTGLTDPVAVVDTLIGDSLALLAVPQLQEREQGAWLDLGAGAGIPGIPLAVALPGVRITLLDAVAKKCAFLEEAVQASGLTGRAQVVCARSERYAAAGSAGREAHGVVLARAVAELAVLVELAAPLLAVDGVLLASKTRQALGEGV